MELQKLLELQVEHVFTPEDELTRAIQDETCVRCGQCCIALSISDEKLGYKPAMVPCKHLGYVDGLFSCEIQDETDRPEICGKYNCHQKREDGREKYHYLHDSYEEGLFESCSPEMIDIFIDRVRLVNKLIEFGLINYRGINVFTRLSKQDLIAALRAIIELSDLPLEFLYRSDLDRVGDQNPKVAKKARFSLWRSHRNYENYKVVIEMLKSED